MKKRIFSGAAPSGGSLTIGNYFGAIKQWTEYQEKYDSIFCVVDLHAITVRQEPKLLKQRVREFVKIYLAFGIDPKKAVIFIQSHRPEHAELTWILDCYTYMGELSRMVQFKDKSKKHPENINVGLFNYPVLMACDILLYQTDIVPVGEDQKQHIEITRDIAQRFNGAYGKIFKIPEAFIPEKGAKIMSLRNPENKMDKSDPNKNNIITLRDTADEITQKIKSAVTDSGKEIKFDTKKKPAISNLLTIYSLTTGKSIGDIEKKYTGRGYANFKKDLAKVLVEFLKPFQKKLARLDKNPDYIKKILKQGAEKIAPIAQKTLVEVKKKIGLG